MLSSEGRYEAQRPLQNTSPNDGKVLQSLQQGAHQLTDLFLNCKLGGVAVTCGGIVTKSLTAMGMCFTFSSEEYVMKNGAKNVTGGGSGHALIVTLNVEKDEYSGHRSVGVKVSGYTGFILYYSKTPQIMSKEVIMVQLVRTCRFNI
jgi:hypothetical protein